MNTPGDETAFIGGVKAAQGSSILHKSFLVRTNDLFQKFSRDQNFFYLSGLLIGSELQNLAGSKIVLAAAASLLRPYQLALESLGTGNRLTIISSGSLEKAVIQGQLIIFRQNIHQ
jgi:2-dehydro-3-deoxygalactonokinase